MLMAERVVAQQPHAGPDRVAVERFQTVLHTCAQCGETTRTDRADGSAADVHEATIERAACDSVVVDLTDGGDGRARRTVTDRTRRIVLDRDGYRCAVPGCDHDLWLELHHVVHRSRGGTNEPSNLVSLCSAHHAMLHEGNLVAETDRNGDVYFDWPGCHPTRSSDEQAA